MGKQGPCCHCGITSTPLWRNGPPEKPVLCNACGSRWRTKGTLVNYTPIHARAFSPLDFGDSKNLVGDKPPSKKSRSQYIQIRNETKIEDGHSFAAYQPYRTCFEDDTSNKSSSGSAISVSESCVQLGNTDGNEISGPFQSSFCDIRIPSKKRTRIRRHSPSPIEKLRQDLVTILEQQDSSYLSEFSEEVLLFEGEAMSFDSETGHGSVLLKPAFSSKEEESEASSRVVGSKICLAETYTESTCCSVKSQNNEISSRQIDKNQMIQDTWNTKDLKENPPKQCASTNIFLEGTLSGNLDAGQSEYSAQASINEKILSNQSSNSARELSPLRCTGSRSSILTKRPRESPDFYTCEGKSSGTVNTLKSSREQSDAELLTSGKDSVHIHASLAGTKNLSPAPQSLSSDVDIFH